MSFAKLFKTWQETQANESDVFQLARNELKQENRTKKVLYVSSLDILFNGDDIKLASEMLAQSAVMAIEEKAGYFWKLPYTQMINSAVNKIFNLDSFETFVKLEYQSSDFQKKIFQIVNLLDSQFKEHSVSIQKSLSKQKQSSILLDEQNGGLINSINAAHLLRIGYIVNYWNEYVNSSKQEKIIAIHIGLFLLDGLHIRKTGKQLFKDEAIADPEGTLIVEFADASETIDKIVYGTYSFVPEKIDSYVFEIMTNLIIGMSKYTIEQLVDLVSRHPLLAKDSLIYTKDKLSIFSKSLGADDILDKVLL